MDQLLPPRLGGNANQELSRATQSYKELADPVLLHDNYKGILLRGGHISKGSHYEVILSPTGLSSLSNRLGPCGQRCHNLRLLPPRLGGNSSQLSYQGGNLSYTSLLSRLGPLWTAVPLELL